MIERKIENKKLYIVYCFDIGSCEQFEDKNDALAYYNQLKQSYIDDLDSEYTGDEHVVFGEVIKEFYSAPDGDTDENGDDYWQFNENTYI